MGGGGGGGIYETSHSISYLSSGLIVLFALLVLTLSSCDLLSGIRNEGSKPRDYQAATNIPRSALR